MQPAFGYLRTSSHANVGDDKDSEPRQQHTIEGFAKANGYAICAWYRDPAVSGSDPVDTRPGFTAMLAALDGVRTIIVESPDRFARDLMVLLTGHNFLRKLGIELIPASAPDFFLNETATAVLVRHLLGAVAQFEKTQLVARLRGARDRKRERTGKKVGGRASHAEMNPELVALAKRLRRKRNGKQPSLRAVGLTLAERGYRNANGRAYSPKSVWKMLRQ